MLNYGRICSLVTAFILFFANAPQWTVQTTGLDTNLRGMSVSCQKNTPCAVWSSGSNGIILRSLDAGNTWQRLTVTGAAELDFRDIEAFGPSTAFVMSSGEGDKSRIYKTTDGGKNWQLQYSDTRSGFFLDSLACDSPQHCVALSDPVNGKFVVLSTNDGEHWKELPGDKMPPALDKEGAFAASGTAIALCNRQIFFGAGGPAARIFRSKDGGISWTAVVTPITSGNASSGVFSLACTDRSGLAAVGGDYKELARAIKVAAYSKDSGETWQLSQTEPGGYRSAVVSLSNTDLVAVGPNGTDVSHDKGVHWQPIDSSNFNVAGFAGTEGWAGGPKGTVARLKNPPN